MTIKYHREKYCGHRFERCAVWIFVAVWIVTLLLFILWLNLTTAHGAMPMMPPMPAAVVEPPDTNVDVLAVILVWTNNGAVGVLSNIVLYGAASGSETNLIVVAVTNQTILAWTNWDESGWRHWFKVESVSSFGTSAPSNETHYPPYPPDHWLFSWSNNVPTTIICSTNLIAPKTNWTAWAGPFTTNRYSIPMTNMPMRYYRLRQTGTTKPDTLKIIPYNPNP